MAVPTAELDGARRQVERGGPPVRRRRTIRVLAEVWLAQGVRASRARADEPGAGPAEVAWRLLEAYPVAPDLPKAGTAHTVSHRQPRTAGPENETASKQKRIGERSSGNQREEVNLSGASEDAGTPELGKAQALGVSDERAFREAAHVSPERTLFRKELDATPAFPCPHTKRTASVAHCGASGASEGDVIFPVPRQPTHARDMAERGEMKPE